MLCEVQHAACSMQHAEDIWSHIRVWYLVDHPTNRRILRNKSPVIFVGFIHLYISLGSVRYSLRLMWDDPPSPHLPNHDNVLNPRCPEPSCPKMSGKKRAFSRSVQASLAWQQAWPDLNPGKLHQTGRWLSPTPLKKMTVNWDNYFQYIWKNRKCSKPPTSKRFMNSWNVGP